MNIFSVKIIYFLQLNCKLISGWLVVVVSGCKAASLFKMLDKIAHFYYWVNIEAAVKYPFHYLNYMANSLEMEWRAGIYGWLYRN